MSDEADPTAVRTALWRALHVQHDPPPHVIVDELGLQLAAPPEGWRERPDMNPVWTAGFRAAIVARARYIEDLVEEHADIDQYVLLGAGLDTFAQRRPELASRVRVFEVDQPGPQAWKRRRLQELGLPLPHRLVSVDFEAGSWWDELIGAGFDPERAAIVASTGVSLYLTHDAITAMLRRLATLAPGSMLAMTYLLPIALSEPAVRTAFEAAARGAAAAGTPFVSFFTSIEIEALARDAGFRDARHVTAAALEARYFAGRNDGLRPPNSEELLVATT